LQLRKMAWLDAPEWKDASTVRPSTGTSGPATSGFL
jgi:hypothetical protein